ncbi:TlpA family protein disulfide reductase [Carboxylicivirga mesophila]|uniref:TlpA family protein disulfide reductase n=1 Tax=Carboxylicivirga mesophila TaxID=1166478 RepID=A0ABS5KGH9_9BACT|nr:TlpA disulfide reductase family protein [Carboxylicivirga mesophila]MBS2213563.1 TlpA family protein disulfide reductase [Carboxylicivirga mesophila]
MKQIISTIALLLMICTACATKQSAEVHLTGKLINFPSVAIMRVGTPEGYILRESLEIKTDENGCFDLKIQLDNPAYYRLGRNTLYLSPGDVLSMEVNLNDPNAAVFNGTGAEANMYLRAKPFPKGGSYIPNVNLNTHPNFDEVIERLANTVEEEQKRLDKLTRVSKQFKMLESGRIQFDAANTLLSYPIYAGWMKKLNDEESKSFKDSADTYFKPHVDAYLKESNNAEYLNIDTYRDISGVVVGLFKADQLNPDLSDFIETSDLCYGLASLGPVKQVLEQRKETEAKLKTAHYKQVVKTAFSKYETLQPGNVASDLTINTIDGQQAKLSDFRGQMVVLDIWATWCGPCKNEAPYFEELARKYKDKPIHFLSISIDSNRKAWKDYLEQHEKQSMQFVCNRSEFKDYELFGVPRFIILDKEGRFIDAFAPAPSNPAFEALIKSNS